MNRTKIKNYAPQARRDFLQAVMDRAAFYGLTEDRIEPVTAEGYLAIIGGRAFPKEIGAKRKVLQERVERDGYGPTMEALAYTWFNRLVAIRYMELHGYLEHGYRVLSNPDPSRSTPEILDQAEHVELPDLNRERVIELKLDGSKEAELYRMLLVAQCNALHSAMPFLFERIGDETELVLPESLLHSDSIVRKLVSGIGEEDWHEVEVIGWLYEAYVTERYEAVIGSVVASADIPAATQRFTPKWIVRYLVQNTLGRQWMATYPQALPTECRKYYIEPVDQTPEVREQVRATTPTSLNPEEITFLDPACGSAHILVEAYDLFRAIYKERGYQAKDIPRLILGKNLFGLEIDDRAAQLAAFALMMKARADDRRIFDQRIQPQVRAMVQTDGMDAEDIAAALDASDSKATPPPGQLFETEDNLFSREASPAIRPEYTSHADVAALVDLFQHAKTIGSLIHVPPALAARLPQIEQKCREVAGKASEISSRTAARFLPVVEQAKMLSSRYDCVVANPPYMGSKYHNATLKAFVNSNFRESKADLYACFIQRNAALSKPGGRVGMITIPNWMFLSSFERIRKFILSTQTIESFIHNGRGIFGSDFGSCNFVFRNVNIPSYSGTFRRLFEKQGSVVSNEDLERRFLEAHNYTPSISDFAKIPGCPLAYWTTDQLRSAFTRFPSLGKLADVRQGLATADDGRFLRLWYEVDVTLISLQGRDPTRTWFPFNKGGPYRRWYGNREHVVNWRYDGREILSFFGSNQRLRSRPQNRDYYFKKGITWSLISISLPSFRLFDETFIFGHKGPGIFSDRDLLPLLAFLNSIVSSYLLQVLSPSVGFEIGQVEQLPVCELSVAAEIAEQAISRHRLDWDSFETSWDFDSLPVLRLGLKSLRESQEAADNELVERFDSMRIIEEENNRLFIDAYGLQEEISSKVSDDQITLYRPNREEDIKRLISYTVGCTMGRYSLDRPGLVYAHGGNVGFDPGQYRTFPADPDGIVPVMEADWFADDAAHRFVEFLGVAWPREGLDENLKFVADALGPSRGEQPRDTIRRYLATGFYRHHLQSYKRRPIYWLFSSGKQQAFQCLVYLHRYHEGTLARMRTEYVIPLQGKLASRIDLLAGDIPKATSTSHRNKLTQEQDFLLKQQVELRAYDEKLRHYADMRVSIDLNDGVRFNYGKLSELLTDFALKTIISSADRDSDFADDTLGE